MNRLNRTQWLAVTTVLLTVFFIIHHIWANWGLVTVHVKGQPLSVVIASISRQGHARIQTDMPGDTQVSMDVDKVPLTDALETLAVVTDSRWRLLYVAAGDKTALKTGEDAWFGGPLPDGWKMFYFPMRGNMMATADLPPLDPRGDAWDPKTAGPAPLQDFLTEAAQATNASFALPQNWNPTVSKAPASGPIRVEWRPSSSAPPVAGWTSSFSLVKTSAASAPPMAMTTRRARSSTWS